MINFLFSSKPISKRDTLKLGSVVKKSSWSFLIIQSLVSSVRKITIYLFILLLNLTWIWTGQMSLLSFWRVEMFLWVLNVCYINKTIILGMVFNSESNCPLRGIQMESKSLTFFQSTQTESLVCPIFLSWEIMMLLTFFLWTESKCSIAICVRFWALPRWVKWAWRIIIL